MDDYLLQLRPIRGAENVDNGAAGAGGGEQGAGGIQREKREGLLVSLNVIRAFYTEPFDANFAGSPMTETGEHAGGGIHGGGRGGGHDAMNITQSFKFVNLDETEIVDVDFEFHHHDDVAGHEADGAHRAPKRELAEAAVLGRVVENHGVQRAPRVLSPAHEREHGASVQKLHDRHPPPPTGKVDRLLERLRVVAFKP